MYTNRNSGRVEWRVSVRLGCALATTADDLRKSIKGNQSDDAAQFRWQHYIRTEKSSRGDLPVHLFDNNNEYTAPFQPSTDKLMKVAVTPKLIDRVATSIVSFSDPSDVLQSSSMGNY